GDARWYQRRSGHPMAQRTGRRQGQFLFICEKSGRIFSEGKIAPGAPLFTLTGRPRRYRSLVRYRQLPDFVPALMTAELLILQFAASMFALPSTVTFAPASMTAWLPEPVPVEVSVRLPESRTVVC